VEAFLSVQDHRTKYNISDSLTSFLNASIAQSSGLRPLNFIMAILKLKTQSTLTIE